MKKEYFLLMEKFWDHTISEEEMSQLQAFMQEDSNLYQEMAEQMHLTGMLRSAGYPDSECENLTNKVDIAIGGSRTLGEFEEKIINSINKVDKPVLKTPKKIMDTAARKKLMINTKKSKKYRPVVKPKSGSSSFFWLAAAASVAVVCGIFLLNKKNDSNNTKTVTIAQIINADAGIVISRNGKKFNANGMTKICLNDNLEGTSGAKIKIRFTDGTIISLKDNSKVSFFRTASGGKKIKLDYGFMEADVAKQVPGKELIIWTPKASATVIGTVFRIDAFSSYSSLTVTEGMVGFQRHSDRKYIKVPAGHFSVTSWDSFVAKSLKPVPKVAKVAPKPEPVKIAPSPVHNKESKVVSFSLVNTKTGKVIQGYENITDGMVIDLSKINAKAYNINVNTMPEKVSHVMVSYQDPHGQGKALKEKFHPYTISGDSLNIGERYFKLKLVNGTYEIKARPFLEDEEGKGLTVKFKVINAK